MLGSYVVKSHLPAQSVTHLLCVYYGEWRGRIDSAPPLFPSFDVLCMLTGSLSTLDLLTNYSHLPSSFETFWRWAFRILGIISCINGRRAEFCMPFNIGFETALVCIELCAQSDYFFKKPCVWMFAYMWIMNMGFSRLCTQNCCWMGSIKFILFFVGENSNIAKDIFIFIGTVAIFKCYVTVVSHWLAMDCGYVDASVAWEHCCSEKCRNPCIWKNS